jgi:hypothetical protein
MATNTAISIHAIGPYLLCEGSAIRCPMANLAVPRKSLGY